MSTKAVLKERVCTAIDRGRDQIVELGETIMDAPELGFKEKRTAERVCQAFASMGLDYEQGLALTGVKAILRGKKPGPTIAIMGELDALLVPDHPRSDPQTGAAHACGHNAQIAGLIGTAMGLVTSKIEADIAGNVVFLAVPAEEYVEIDYRLKLVDQGKLTFLAGKPELLELGHFDDIDMALMIHSGSADFIDGAMGVSASSNGFVAKNIRFIGRAAHAGVAPGKGINALNAATLALSAINAQRETFRDQDCVRIHPIITKGGDLVNIVPAEVCMETYVRARSQEAVYDASRKVDQALKGAAMAVGAKVEIETVPGYLPLQNDHGLAKLFKANASQFFKGDVYREYPHSGGSTDAGDLSQIMPVLHPVMTGAKGTIHGPDWHIADVDAGYVVPAKTLATMVVDLLAGKAEEAQRILGDFRPQLSKETYLGNQKGIFKKEVFGG